MTTRSISKAIRHKVQLPTILLVDTYMSTGKLSVSQVPVKVLGEQQAGAAPHMALCKTGWHLACQLCISTMQSTVRSNAVQYSEHGFT